MLFKIIEIAEDGNETYIAGELPTRESAETFLRVIDPDGARTLSIQKYGEIIAIEDAKDLVTFAVEHNLSHDWHEPDNNDVGARIIGDHLDNAFGSTVAKEQHVFGEFNVVLTKEGTDVAVVNLATLLSWGAKSANG